MVVMIGMLTMAAKAMVFLMAIIVMHEAWGGADINKRNIILKNKIF